MLPIAPISHPETLKEGSMGIDAEMSVNGSLILSYGVLGKGETGSHFLARPAIEQKIEHHSQTRRKSRNGDPAILRPALLVQPRQFTEKDVGDASLALGEWRIVFTSIYTDRAHRSLIDGAQRKNERSDVRIAKKSIHAGGGEDRLVHNLLPPAGDVAGSLPHFSQKLFRRPGHVGMAGRKQQSGVTLLVESAMRHAKIDRLLARLSGASQAPGPGTCIHQFADSLHENPLRSGKIAP